MSQQTPGVHACGTSIPSQWYGVVLPGDLSPAHRNSSSRVAISHCRISPAVTVPQHAQAPPVDRETQRPALTTTVCFASCDGVRALPPLKPPRGRRPRHLMSLDRIAESANHIRVAMITPSPAVMADKSGVTSTGRYGGWVSNNTMRQWRYLRIPTISCGRLFATSLA